MKVDATLSSTPRSSDPMPRPLLCPPDLLARDLSGETHLVTGGNSGIGLVTVRQLARQGARVILACRRPAEGERVRGTIMAEGPRGSVEVGTLDLASLASVRSFAADFLAANDRLHGLVNNAGVMNTPAGKTADGFETQLGTNHLGHYLLTELLLPALQRAAPARIVNVSSCYHDLAFGREGRIDFDDLHFERRRYDGWAAYAQSKLANVLHARHLARRLADTGVSAVSVHPGWVRTNLIAQSIPLWVQDVALRPVLRLAGMLEPWEGAQTTLYALLSPEVPAHAGGYFSQVGLYRDRRANRGGWPLTSPSPHAHDDAAAERLDALSRQLVGLA
jgi:NAD(P)-dependent dehydrogenase (short-subunit alcohol dehydrogenase family)